MQINFNSPPNTQSLMKFFALPYERLRSPFTPEEPRAWGYNKKRGSNQSVAPSLFYQNLFKADLACLTTCAAGTSFRLNSSNGSRIFSICLP